MEPEKPDIRVTAYPQRCRTKLHSANHELTICSLYRHQTQLHDLARRSKIQGRCF